LELTPVAVIRHNVGPIDGLFLFDTLALIMLIQKNIPIAQYTTFKIGGPARYFCAVKNEDDLLEAVKFSKEKKLPILVIGGGSNLLVADSGFNGMVIRNEIKGKDWKEGNDGIVTVTAGAGEDWEGLVKESVDRGLYGLEGLSSIPGTVGASPVQNIGAYGVDVSHAIKSVRAFDTTALGFVSLSNEDCGFTYRDSMFKHEKGRYIISAVTYELSKNGKVSVEYKDLKDYFAKKGNSQPTLKDVREAVIEIRKNKLPDWTDWGTAGSFFKNPVVSAQKFTELKKLYPELPGFTEQDGHVKLSLGWILDKLCNAKGLTIGNVGTYEKQALVVVAKPGATAQEVLDFSNELMRRVKDKTGIEIEGEVEWAVA
jgi:UDP-N-acetylmuramate dehydrogenase